MSSIQRLGHIGLGVLMLLASILLFSRPDSGLPIVAVMLGIALLLYGMRKILYYLTMARHMVGGYALLFVGIIAIDVGAFTLTLLDEPRMAIILYLVATTGFSGVVRILRSAENKKLGAPWVLSMVLGIVSLLFAVLCIVFMQSDDIIGLIFFVGLFASGIRHIAWAFRRTDVAFIQ